jgi:spore germination protein KB
VLDNGRISSVQLLLLLFMIEVSTTILYLPARVAELAGRDGWLAVSILPMLYALLISGVALSLARRFPSRVFTDYLPDIVGRIPGKLLSAVYAAFFIQVAATVVNQGAGFMHITSYPRTPVVVLETVLAGVAAYGAYLGIECIARQNELVWPVWVGSFLLIILLASRDLNLSNLKPVLENGLLPVIRGSIVVLPWRGYVFFLLLLFPYLNQKQEASQTAILYLGLVTLEALCATFVIVGVLGCLVTAHAVYPFFVLSQYISIGNVLERLDILVIIIWVAGVIVKLAVFFHSAGIAAASALGLKNYRTTLMPIAITAVVLSKVLYPTYLRLDNFLFTTFPATASVMELAVPALILLVAVIGKKGGSPAAAR